MKLITLNVAIRQDNTAQVIDFLRAAKADIILLQETTHALEPSVLPAYRSHDQIAKALRATNPHNFFGALWASDAFRVGGKTALAFGGRIEQGLDIFSRYPIAQATNEFFYKHFALQVDWTDWRAEDHGRAVQVAVVEIGSRRLQILNLHGIWTADKRGDSRTEHECAYLLEAARRRNLPTIIAGDFNLLPGTPSLAKLDAGFRNLLPEFGIRGTRPTMHDELDEGGQTVDYVFVDDGIKVTDFHADGVAISDHLPLTVEFELA